MPYGYDESDWEAAKREAKQILAERASDARDDPVFGARVENRVN